VSGNVGEKLKTVAKRGGEGILAHGNGSRALSVIHIGNYYAPHTGGIETHLRDLVSWQSSRVPVQVVVANVVAKARLTTETEILDGAQITRVACFGILASQPICPSLPWKLKGRSDSIVHLHLPNPWAAQAYLISGHKGKLVISHHADTLGRRQLRRLVGPLVRRAMKRAEAIIVPSQRYLDSSEELADFRGKCRFIPYGIDGNGFRVDAEAEVRGIQAKYGPRLIVAVGRMVPYKGFEYLLQAMREVDATLLLIGNGPLRGQLEAAVERLGIGRKVHLLGHVGNLVPYYKASQMLVLPSVSRAESFGIVQLEAMAAGIPVVNTDLDSCVPEVSVDGVTGITVPPKDAKALANAIRTLLDDPETRAKYGRAALVRANEEFSAQRMAERTFEVYQSVL
jgi:glycosyltransferase involved in cell wall biosynthesis